MDCCSDDDGEGDGRERISTITPSKLFNATPRMPFLNGVSLLFLFCCLASIALKRTQIIFYSEKNSDLYYFPFACFLVRYYYRRRFVFVDAFLYIVSSNYNTFVFYYPLSNFQPKNRSHMTDHGLNSHVLGKLLHK